MERQVIKRNGAVPRGWRPPGLSGVRRGPPGCTAPRPQNPEPPFPEFRIPQSSESVERIWRAYLG